MWKLYSITNAQCVFSNYITFWEHLVSSEYPTYIFCSPIACLLHYSPEVRSCVLGCLCTATGALCKWALHIVFYGVYRCHSLERVWSVVSDGFYLFVAFFCVSYIPEVSL